MSATRHFCPLYVAIDGGEALRDRLGEAEALQAFERCFNRLERAISSHHGRVVKLAGNQLLAAFEHVPDALRAACDIQQRVERLPAVSGIKLGAAIGLHYGPALDKQNDAGGDTVRLALRLMQLARAGQVLTSSDCVALLPDSTRRATLALDNTQVKLNGHTLAVHAVVWQTLVTNNPAQLTESHAPSLHASRAPAPADTRCLLLCHGARQHRLDAAQPRLRLGRDPSCELVLQTPHASRQHAHIELRPQGFVFIDHSTNGTRIAPQGEAEYLLRHAEMALQGSGQISIGLLGADDGQDETDTTTRECLHYRVE